MKQYAFSYKWYLCTQKKMETQFKPPTGYTSSPQKYYTKINDAASAGASAQIAKSELGNHNAEYDIRRCRLPVSPASTRSLV